MGEDGSMIVILKGEIQDARARVIQYVGNDGFRITFKNSAFIAMNSIAADPTVAFNSFKRS